MVSIAQLALVSGLHPKTIRRRVADGTLPAHRIGPRCIRIDRDTALAFLGATPVVGDAA
jgi:excisionase family DNA binding protein